MEPEGDLLLAAIVSIEADVSLIRSYLRQGAPASQEPFITSRAERLLQVGRHLLDTLRRRAENRASYGEDVAEARLEALS